MLLKSLINKSVYATNGYINSLDTLNKLEQYIVYNLSILKEFKQIVIATNYSDIDLFRNSNKELWTKYFPDCVLIDSHVNNIK
jgi:hypothetical protein